PASTSHSQLTEEQKNEGGLSPDLIRLSIGLEHPDDLIEALDDALKGVESKETKGGGWFSRLLKK
ncbi:MAG: bifunctional O-acetylhomoserine aminocarboxypropyltransferase/cysteine synthase, partial [Chlorobiaceae bacterium]|nr:bifunctional O-acetylhomoserine aminocarboxypropyltransferase/cysteine synthase [Chlorobiaceae bacterium]